MPEGVSCPIFFIFLTLSLFTLPPSHSPFPSQAPLPRTSVSSTPPSTEPPTRRTRPTPPSSSPASSVLSYALGLVRFGSIASPRRRRLGVGEFKESSCVGWGRVFFLGEGCVEEYQSKVNFLSDKKALALYCFSSSFFHTHIPKTTSHGLPYVTLLCSPLLPIPTHVSFKIKPGLGAASELVPSGLSRWRIGGGGAR